MSPKKAPKQEIKKKHHCHYATENVNIKSLEKGESHSPYKTDKKKGQKEVKLPRA
jgi:hypothetical protein